MGRAMARYSKKALVSEVLKDPVAKHYMITQIGMLVRRELVSMCSVQCITFCCYFRSTNISWVVTLFAEGDRGAQVMGKPTLPILPFGL